MLTLLLENFFTVYTILGIFMTITRLYSGIRSKGKRTYGVFVVVHARFSRRRLLMLITLPSRVIERHFVEDEITRRRMLNLTNNNHRRIFRLCPRFAREFHRMNHTNQSKRNARIP